MPNTDERPRESWFYMGPARMVLGLLFLAAAIGGAIHQSHMTEPSRLGRFVLSVLAIMGFVTVFRGGATLDRSKRRVTRWWGPFLPLVRKHIPFDAIRSVQIGLGLRPGDDIPAAYASDQSYHMAIETDQEAIVLRTSKSLEKVRHYGSLIAEAVGCPVREKVPARLPRD